MRRAVLILLLGVCAALALLWTTGAFATLGEVATAAQRRFQTAMAGALRGLRAGDPGAYALLMGLCFAYGVAHAAGPGHGKVVIGGYGVARRVTALRLSAIALLASLAQAASAVVLVGAGVWILNWGRVRMTGLAETVLAPVSYVAIALIGLWLLWRGLRHLMAFAGRSDQGHGVGHAACGHRHGPDVAEVEKLSSVREALVLIAGIALRPCTGALFLLIVTSQMGLFAAGIAGTFAMGLGTGAVTAGVGLAAVGLRGGTAFALGQGRNLRLALPLIECFAGASVAVIAAGLAARSLGG